jgi:2-C-methyl-D-erythritol 4-phosphate cytidylyltransferase
MDLIRAGLKQYNKAPPFLIFENESALLDCLKMLRRGKMSQISAVIVGAGRSERMGADKIFLPLHDKPLLAWSVDVFQNYEPVNQIVIVLNKNNLNYGQRLVTERSWTKVISVCLGGSRRQDSVIEGLKNLKECEWIIVHDGARPFLTVDLLDSGLEAARTTGAAAAAIPVRDTIKLSDNDGIVKETFQRNHLWAVQTPQIFRFDLITQAYKQIKDDVTDDASLVERLGGRVKLYLGSYRNIKITTPEDLVLAEILAKGQ